MSGRLARMEARRDSRTAVFGQSGTCKSRSLITVTVSTALLAGA
jgi:hypothetical protein